MEWIHYFLSVVLLLSSTTLCNDYNLYQNQSTYATHTHRKENKSIQDSTQRSQRMNERSLQSSSGIQRIQEQERRRIEPRIEEFAKRIENGTYKIVNTFSKVIPTLTSRRDAVDDGSVVFPGLTSRSSMSFVPEVPKECLKTGICEDALNYPEEHVASIIAKLPDKDRFKIENLDTPEIAQRIGPADENIELCVFKERIIMPRAAQDKEGKWYFILNQKDKPLQGYRVEICQRDESPCSEIAYFNAGYKAGCKQKFAHRFMTGLDEAGQMVEKPFKLPTCCSCVARLTID